MPTVCTCKLPIIEYTPAINRITSFPPFCSSADSTSHNYFKSVSHFNLNLIHWTQNAVFSPRLRSSCLRSNRRHNYSSSRQRHNIHLRSSWSSLLSHSLRLHRHILRPTERLLQLYRWKLRQFHIVPILLLESWCRADVLGLRAYVPVCIDTPWYTFVKPVQKPLGR
jgi:hypothetical protein